jgi:hypothetical protein
MKLTEKEYEAMMKRRKILKGVTMQILLKVKEKNVNSLGKRI